VAEKEKKKLLEQQFHKAVEAFIVAEKNGTIDTSAYPAEDLNTHDLRKIAEFAEKKLTERTKKLQQFIRDQHPDNSALKEFATAEQCKAGFKQAHDKFIEFDTRFREAAIAFDKAITKHSLYDNNQQLLIDHFTRFIAEKYTHILDKASPEMCVLYLERYGKLLMPSFDLAPNPPLGPQGCYDKAREAYLEFCRNIKPQYEVDHKLTKRGERELLLQYIVSNFPNSLPDFNTKDAERVIAGRPPKREGGQIRYALNKLLQKKESEPAQPWTDYTDWTPAKNQESSDVASNASKTKASSLIFKVVCGLALLGTVGGIGYGIGSSRSDSEKDRLRRRVQELQDHLYDERTNRNSRTTPPPVIDPAELLFPKRRLSAPTDPDSKPSNRVPPSTNTNTPVTRSTERPSWQTRELIEQNNTDPKTGKSQH